jgi:hypothetical protein
MQTARTQRRGAGGHSGSEKPKEKPRAFDIDNDLDALIDEMEPMPVRKQKKNGKGKRMKRCFSPKK